MQEKLNSLLDYLIRKQSYAFDTNIDNIALAKQQLQLVETGIRKKEHYSPQMWDLIDLLKIKKNIENV